MSRTPACGEARNVSVGVEASLAPELGPRLPLGLYTANLPPHLLPWILSSHLHHLARAHQVRLVGTREASRGVAVRCLVTSLL